MHHLGLTLSWKVWEAQRSAHGEMFGGSPRAVVDDLDADNVTAATASSSAAGGAPAGEAVAPSHHDNLSEHPRAVY